MLQKCYKPEELVCQAIFSETESLNDLKKEYNLTEDEMITFISEMEDRLHAEF